MTAAINIDLGHKAEKMPTTTNTCSLPFTGLSFGDFILKTDMVLSSDVKGRTIIGVEDGAHQ